MSEYLPYILVMALVTYLIRMIPLTLFQKEIHNKFIQSFLFYVPYAVLGAMTFPAIFTSGGSETYQIFASMIGCGVALLLSYKGKGLLVVAIAACICVYIVSLLLKGFV